MSRLHTVASVLIGTGIAASTSAYALNGQRQAPALGAGQATSAKVVDLSALLSNRPPAGLAISPSHASQSGSTTLGTCPCAGSPPENEPGCGIPVDTVNGGCNSTPFIYSPITIGGSVCGTAAWNGSFRDTDWYQFTLAAPSPVTWTVTSEFPAALFILDNLCPPSLLASGTAGGCVPGSVSTGTLAAGTYVAFVAPDFGGPTFACGPGGDYQGTLSGTGCTSPTNDNCGSATAISGNGPWFGTNQCSSQDGPSLCGGMGSDVWFDWTANVTGNVTFNTCNPGTSYDTVLSIYDGSGCTGTNLGCNDDITCNPIFRSGLTVPVVNGQLYKIQVGGFGGAQGNIELNVAGPPPPAGPCDILDDGTTDNSVGTNNPADDILWMQSMSDGALSTTVTAISTAWGSPLFGGANAPPDGSPARVGIWSDPNNDGNPSDAVLLQEVATVIVGSNTDAFQTVNLAPPVLVNGRYFVGASCLGGTFQAPLDQNSGAGLGRVWIAGQQGGSIDYTNINGASIPPLDEDQVAPGVWLLRATCGSPIVNFCYPGNAGVMACPCGNPPSGLRGCNNFGQFTGGALLNGSGNPSLSADTLSLSATFENNTSLTVFWTGTTSIPGGVVHGAGIRCVTGLKRIYTGSASGGAITRPGMGGPTVSAATGNIVAGQTRHYFTVYRDPQAAGPCANTSSTVNLSNGVSAIWGP